MRILFVHSGSDLYGASRSLLRLSSRLVRDGHVVNVVLPSEGPLVAALQEQKVGILIQTSLPVLERQKAKSISGILFLFVNVILSTFHLIVLLVQFKPHLIHTMTAVLVSSGLAAKIMGVPHIWHVRESFAEFGKLWRFYQKYMLLFSSKIVCVSTPIAQQFTHRKDNKKILVMHNGFPVEEFAEITQERIEQFRSKYAAHDGIRLVGVVGRIKFRRKGQEVFVRAASLLQENFLTFGFCA